MEALLKTYFYKTSVKLAFVFKSFTLVYCILLCLHIPASESIRFSKIDSLKVKLHRCGIGSLRVDLLNKISQEYRDISLYDSALFFANEEMRIANLLNDKIGIARAYNNIGHAFLIKGNISEGLSTMMKSLKICEENGYKQVEAECCIFIGSVYLGVNNEKSLEYYSRALKLSKTLEDNNSIIACYNNIGVVYENLHQLPDALKNYQQCLNLLEQNRAESIKVGNYNYYASAILSNIGNIYINQKDYKKGLKNILRGLKLREEIDFKQGIGDSYYLIGKLYMNTHKYTEAEVYINKAIDIQKQLGVKGSLKESYELMSKLFAEQGNYKSAVKYYDFYTAVNDSILNENTNKQIAEINVRFDSEKKNKEIIKKDSQIEIQKREGEKKQIQLNFILIGFVFTFLLIVFLYKVYQDKKYINSQLIIKNELIENQKLAVDETNKKITDSINYAKRIQQVIIPSEEKLKKVFSDAFVLYQPKDIVSGDFYWIYTKENLAWLAVADCTGHGVPGALMSMMGYNLLEQIVKGQGVTEPDKILMELNHNMVKTLQYKAAERIAKEGIDIAMCKIDYSKGELTYAAAHSPLYLVRQKELISFKADRVTVGIDASFFFTSQTIKLEKGDRIYLFSDGFPDQMGGKENKKFFYKPFQELLLENHDATMNEQKEILKSTLNNWRGSNQQTDDVLVVGILL